MNLKQLQARVSALLIPTGVAAYIFLSQAAPALAFVQGEGSTPRPPDPTIGELIVKSGTIGMFIVALSVLGLAMVIEQFVSLRRDKLAPPEIIDEIQALFDEEKFQEAMELCEDEPTFFTRICAAGIAKIGHDFSTIEKAIEEMGDEESIKLHQKVGWLALVANVAPMLGLLGTVQGMIISFNELAASGGQASPAELANGISIALLTTMEGLVVAIPMTTAYAYIRNRTIKAVIEVGAIVADLFERFRGKTA